MTVWDQLRDSLTEIHYVREADGWIARGQLQGFRASASGRTLAAARAEVLRLLAGDINAQWQQSSAGRPGVSVLLPGGMPVTDRVQLPARSRRAVDNALRTRAAAKQAALTAAEALAHAVRALDHDGLSLRDAGELLELSHARVAQVLEQSSAQEEAT